MIAKQICYKGFRCELTTGGEWVKIVAIYDNSKTFDRYTVITNIRSNDSMASNLYDALCISRGGDGFSQWCEVNYDPNGYNRHLGRKTTFSALDAATQKHIAKRLFMEDTGIEPAGQSKSGKVKI